MSNQQAFVGSGGVTPPTPPSTATTVGAETKEIFSVPLGSTPGVFEFEARVAAYDADTPSGAGYKVFGAFITDGSNCELIGTATQPIYQESIVLENADALYAADGNNAVLTVVGVTGLTINWKAEYAYT